MNKTLKLACTAMFTALSIAANFATIQLNASNSVSFTIAICFIAGIYLGALPAAVVGYLGDLIAHLISPHGAYNWYLALSTTLFGVICALVYKIRMHKLLKLTVAIVICFVVCSCALNTFGLWLQYVVGVEAGLWGLVEFVQMDKGAITKSFWVYLGARAPFMAINAAINGVIVGVLQQSKALDKLFASLQNKMDKKRCAGDGVTEEAVAVDPTAQPSTAASLEEPKTTENTKKSEETAETKE